MLWLLVRLVGQSRPDSVMKLLNTLVCTATVALPEQVQCKCKARSWSSSVSPSNRARPVGVMIGQLSAHSEETAT